METREALRVRSVSTRRGRSGSATRASIQTKSASSAAPEARSATVSGLLQLEVSAWERPKTTANRPAETVAVPARSSRGVFAGAASLRSSASAPTTVSAAKSTLTYNDEAPVEELRQHAAEQQADRGAAAADRAVDAERPGALGALGEAGREQGEGGGGEQRAGGPLQRSRTREDGEGRGGTAERRGEREAGRAADQRPLAPEEIAELAAEQEHAAEGERVRGDDPLPLVVGEMQRRLRRGQCDVHDGHVEHDHQLGDAGEGEDPPAPGVRRGLLRHGCSDLIG